MTDATGALAESGHAQEESAEKSEKSPKAKPYLVTGDRERKFASDVRFDDPGRLIYWSEADTIQAKFCRQKQGVYSEAHSRLFASHDRRDKKDGRTFFAGRLFDGLCRTPNVERIDLIIADIDCAEGAELAKLIERIKEAGLGCDIYSTHNHAATQSEVKYDAYTAACKTWSLDPSSSEAAQRYLREIETYPQKVSDAAYVEELCVQRGGGTAVALGHPPIIKLRIAFTLDESYVPCEIVNRGFSDKDARTRVWPTALAILFKALGIPYDVTGTALAHRFYSASCRPTAVPYVHRIDGAAVRLKAILPKSSDEWDALGSNRPKTSRRSARSDNRAREEFSYQGFNLKAWIAQYGSTFELENALRSHPENEGVFRQERREGGVHIECPFEDEHSEPGGTGTFIVNASENGDRGIGVHCCHESCLTIRGNGQCVDRVISIKRMLELGWLTLEDLQNREFGGGPISTRLYNRSRCGAQRRDLKVVDKNGTGIDACVCHANFVTKSGVLDLLNARCDTHIDSDATAQQFAEFIEVGRIAATDLIACLRNANETPDDAYRSALRELADQKQSGSALSKDVGARLKAMKAEFKVNKKDAEHDLKKMEENIAAELLHVGILSEEETALLTPMRDYIARFAIINTGGKGVVLNLAQPDLFKALMPRDDFEFLYRKDWFEVETEQGRKTVYPAKCFLQKPPKDAHVFHDGIVFKPCGTVGAGEYNLYQGMLIEPDPSGSCSLLPELIRDVWAGGDTDTTQWVLEYLMHIIAHPGDKPGTSIAIRGKPGDGKSFVFEKLMSTILGDMVLRVANHRMILGDFNEAAIAKLAIVLEEAAFAGDKAAFDKMKELVTGDKILINPKFKAPITVDNHARLIVVSNHEHFLHIKPGDRRYTVLESSPAWNGTNKFEQLISEWAKGGAARFVYDALNHSFRKLDDRKRLIINTNLKTKAAVHQIAQSRFALDKCVVGFLLRGEFKSPKTGERMPLPVCDIAGNCQIDGNAHTWPLDHAVKIQSQALEDAVNRWLREFDATAAKYETLHTIIATLDTHVGETSVERPKGKKDPTTGVRPQLPGERILPARKDAIKHARERGLITEEEYDSALPSDEGGG